MELLPALPMSADEDEVIAEGVVAPTFDLRCPVTVSEARKIETEASVRPGTYFVSTARNRIRGMIELHERWLSRRTNSCSGYTNIQRDLSKFFEEMLENFDKRYTYYTTHPAFNKVGRIRRRRTSPSAN